MGSVFAGSMGVLLFFLLAIALVLWIFLPFSVFGIKPKLDELISLQRLTLFELQKINARADKQNES